MRRADPGKAANGRGLIEIKPGMVGLPRMPRAERNPVQFWGDYFQKHDEQPGQVLETVVLLRNEQKWDDVEAVLRAYLNIHAARAEPWMYEMYAIAIERRKGPKEIVRTLLGYAAMKSLQGKNPSQILGVADLLVRRGIVDKVGTPPSQTSAGELLDLVAKRVPHRVEPLLMSLNVASQTKDPRRMADTAEALLSLGWPGMDEQVRREARARVGKLAEALRQDGRPAEADALEARLRQSDTRDLYVRLHWEGKDDLDLVVEEPLGATAQLYKTPRTVFGGAIVTNGFGSHPEEIYVCPRGFSGVYTIKVDKIFQPDPPARTATVEIITHEKMADQKVVETITVDLADPKPIVVRLEGGRRKDVLPFMSEPTEPATKPAAGPAPKPTPPARPGVAPAPVKP